MEYKALMLDVDGTLIPYDYDALPSEKLVKALRKVHKKISINLVTGRSAKSVLKILNELDIHSGFAVVNNGSQVINLLTQELVYDQPINPNDTKLLFDILVKERVEFFVKDDAYNENISNGYYHPGQNYKKVYMLFTNDDLSEKKADRVVRSLHKITDLTIHKTHHKNPHTYALNITHVNATKLHGIYAIQKELRIAKDETIGVGDSYNDFPLLMACGLKIAMGNAVPELKEIADYIAPSVEDDGVVDVINRFILKGKSV